MNQALEIKRLVHGEGYTLSGARQALEGVQHRRDPQASSPIDPSQASHHGDAVAAAIGRARVELSEIIALLSVAPQPRQPRHRVRLAAVSSETERLFPL
jgi:hypothetical protein